MIPFNHLGFVFKNFGSLIYSKVIRERLHLFLEPLRDGSSILDVGAGTGMMSEFAHDYRENLIYVAIDPYEGMLKYAPEYLQTHIASAEALPFEENSFDALMMGESLHHFNDPSIAFSEFSRVLKKGGRLFIYDFDISSFLGKSICIIEKLLGEPGHFYEPKVLKKFLQEYGFEVEVTQHRWRYTVSGTLK